jgi:hypothetical protein
MQRLGCSTTLAYTELVKLNQKRRAEDTYGVDLYVNDGPSNTKG